MNKIRILHIVQSAGGVERYLQMLLKYTDTKCFENILVCSRDYKNVDSFQNIENVEYVDMVRNISFRSDLNAIVSVRRLIRKYRPDIVYMHSSKAGAIGRIANMGIRNRSIYNPHGWAFNMRGSELNRKIYVGIERFLAFFCDRIVCISQNEKICAMKKKICPEKKLEVIINGIDVEKYEEDIPSNTISRASLGIPENAYVVGTVGRLTEQKAPDVFIQSAARIRREIPEAFFVMVGDGSMKEEVYALAEKAGLSDALLITGWVNEPLMYIRLFDVAVLLSRWEGFGLALPEYMLAKKPIVATAVDAIPTIVQHEKNGILVEPDNPTQVKDAVLRLDRDQKLVERMTLEGLRKVKDQYDARRVGQEHKQLFLSLKRK